MKSFSSIESFTFFIGAYFAPKFEITIKENTVTYAADTIYIKSGQPHVKTISQEEFKMFFEKINELGIYNWKSRFDTVIAVDGEEWELNIKYNGNRKKKIYGCNMYPGLKTDSSSRTRLFNSLLKELKNIIKEPTFFTDKFMDKQKEKA